MELEGAALGTGFLGRGRGLPSLGRGAPLRVLPSGVDWAASEGEGMGDSFRFRAEAGSLPRVM